MKDRRGVEIKPGDTVIHLGRSSSRMWADVGIVRGVIENTAIVEYENGSTGKPYTWQNLIVVNGVPNVNSNPT